MRREHWHWLSRNLAAVNAAFETDFSIDTQEARDHAENCLTISDTEKAFNANFSGVYLRDEVAFELQCEEGLAAFIDGKYVSFQELKY